MKKLALICLLLMLLGRRMLRRHRHSPPTQGRCRNGRKPISRRRSRRSPKDGRRASCRTRRSGSARSIATIRRQDAVRQDPGPREGDGGVPRRRQRARATGSRARKIAQNGRGGQFSDAADTGERRQLLRLPPDGESGGELSARSARASRTTARCASSRADEAEGGLRKDLQCARRCCRAPTCRGSAITSFSASSRSRM